MLITQRVGCSGDFDMDSIKAVAELATAEERGAPDKASMTAPGHDMAPVSDIALDAIRLLDKAGLRPADDRATQTRLANALTRSIASTAEQPDRVQALSSIMNDVLLQEAAAARLVAAGRRDPLDAVSDPASNRGALNAASMLKRSNVNAHALLDRADVADTTAIATGRYDAIQSEHTRFAVSSQLRLDARAMSTPTVIPIRAPTSIAKGPADVGQTMAVAFGRRNVAER
jgi:hypothetical protein